MYKENLLLHKSEDFITDFDVSENFIVVSTYEGALILENEVKINIKKITKIKIFKDIIFFGNICGDLFIYSNGDSIKFSIHSDKISNIDLIEKDNETFILTSSFDECIKIWKFDQKIFQENKLKSLFYIKTLDDNTEPITIAKFTEQKNTLSSSIDGSLTFYDVNQENKRKFGQLSGKNKNFFDVFEFNSAILGQTKGAINKFTPKLEYFTSGHTKSVNSLDWFEKSLLTSSSDRTSRIFEEKEKIWREVSRPIIHGFEINCCKFLGPDILCASEETFIRVYEPTNFSQKLRGLPQNYENEFCTNAELSLTNQVSEEKMDEELNEKTLSEYSLFYEKKVVREHFFEVNQIEVSKDYVFTSNKSSCKQYAGLTVFDKNMVPKNYIENHELTINKIRVSKCDKYLLTISRDKTSTVYSMENFQIIKKISDHTREIFGCGFSFDSNFFATCGRDKMLFIYNLQDFSKKEIKMEEIPTSVEFTEKFLIVGTIKGNAYFYEIDKIKKNILKEDFILRIHGKRINDIKYNHKFNLLASAGEDNLVRIFEFN